MAANPLQQYFRQPKIFISLPSQGLFQKLGSFSGDATNLAVCGMTGMDEIIMRTPDALLTGESSVRVIQSCCNSIKDAWETSILDTTVIFTAIRIATFGNTMSVSHTCPSCSTDNQYDIDLSRIIEHYRTVRYNNKLVVDQLTINTRPLTYRESTQFSLRNFQLQQKLSQLQQLTEQEEQQAAINKLFLELSQVRNDIYRTSIESIEADNTTVTDPAYIAEFLQNCDKTVFDSLSEHVEKNREVWRSPDFDVVCENCSSKNKLNLELDQSNFFA